MGLCVSTPRAKEPLEEERQSPWDIIPQADPTNAVRQGNAVEPPPAVPQCASKGGEGHKEHVHRAQLQPSSSSSTSDGGFDDNRHYGRSRPSPNPKAAVSAQPPSPTAQAPTPVPATPASPPPHPSLVAAAAAAATAAAAAPAAAAHPVVHAYKDKDDKAKTTQSRQAQRKKAPTRRSAEQVGSAAQPGPDQHQRHHHAPHKSKDGSERSVHAHEAKARVRVDQTLSGKQRLRESQILQVPQEDIDAANSKNKVDDRAHSFLPPLIDIKQLQEKQQHHKSYPSSPQPQQPMVVHAVPAARGGPSEPGLWVLRRTGSVTDKYVMTEVMGRGQFGIVYVAVEKTTGDKWACKSVSKRRVQGMHDFSMADVLREVELLYLVGGHPGVVGLREVYEDEEDLHLIMELCLGGDWFEHLLTDGRYTEAEAAQVVHGVLEALAYCHSLGVMHRDIKPENIMFTDRSRTATVKLTDFGLSTMFAGLEPLSEVLGSAYYVAPEVLRECYSKEADVWSLGVVLFIALGGYAPFDGKNEREVFTKILHEPLQFADPSWDDISLSARDLIFRMLTKNPTHRITVHECLCHPWFNEVLPPRTSHLSILPRSPSLTALGQPVRPLQQLPRGERFRVEVSAGSEPSAIGRSVSAAVRNQGRVGWADDVVGGERDSGGPSRPVSAKRHLMPTNSQARRARSIAAALEAASARGAMLHTVPDAVVARLQQFAAMNAFKREARRVLATQLPEEEVVGLLTLFRTMDSDKDGVVSMSELCQALEQRGVHVSNEHAKLLFKRSHLSGQEGVDYVEFLAATLHLGRLERDERLWRAFRHFDTENTGFISRANLVSALPHLGKKVDKAVDRILAEVDKDGDGRICYAEFCDMLRHQPDPPELSHDPQVAATAQNAPAGHWGAYAEETESGRLQLAVPPESRYPTRAQSLASSRNVSSNERSKSAASSGLDSSHTRHSSAGDSANSHQTPQLLTNVLNQLHSTRPGGTGGTSHNSAHTRGSSNSRVLSSVGARSTRTCASNNSHAGSSRFGSMREAAAIATGNTAYLLHRPVERAAAAAVAQYPEPSVSNDDEDNADAGSEARRSWAASARATRQRINFMTDDSPRPSNDTNPEGALAAFLLQRREDEGMPRPIMRTERSARTRQNSRVQWALPDDEEVEDARKENEEMLSRLSHNTASPSISNTTPTHAQLSPTTVTPLSRTHDRSGGGGSVGAQSSGGGHSSGRLGAGSSTARSGAEERCEVNSVGSFVGRSSGETERVAAYSGGSHAQGQGPRWAEKGGKGGSLREEESTSVVGSSKGVGEGSGVGSGGLGAGSSRAGTKRGSDETAASEQPSLAFGMGTGTGSSVCPIRDASGGHGSAAAAVRRGSTPSDQSKASLSFRLLKTSALPGVVGSYDGSSPPTPSAQPSLAPVRTHPSKAQQEGGMSSPSTHCSSPLYEGPCKGQLAARPPTRLHDVPQNERSSCPGSTGGAGQAIDREKLLKWQQQQLEQEPHLGW